MSTDVLAVSGPPVPALAQRRILVLGYGNPGREDDGLGPAAAAELERMNWPHVTVRENYQLVIEDAIDVAEADVVWFIDSAKTGLEPYELRRISCADDVTFTTHVVKPEVILALAKGYYGKAPEAFLLGIRGYEFGFREGLTQRARRNLQEAVSLLKQMISHGEDEQR